MRRRPKYGNPPRRALLFAITPGEIICSPRRQPTDERSPNRPPSRRPCRSHLALGVNRASPRRPTPLNSTTRPQNRICLCGTPRTARPGTHPSWRTATKSRRCEQRCSIPWHLAFLGSLPGRQSRIAGDCFLRLSRTAFVFWLMSLHARVLERCESGLDGVSHAGCRRTRLSAYKGNRGCHVLDSERSLAVTAHGLAVERGLSLGAESSADS